MRKVVLKVTILSIFQKHPHHTQETVKNDSKQEYTGNPLPIYTGETSRNDIRNHTRRISDGIGRRRIGAEKRYNKSLQNRHSFP